MEELMKMLQIHGKVATSNNDFAKLLDENGIKYKKVEMDRINVYIYEGVAK